MSYRPLSKKEAYVMSRPSLIEDGTYECTLLQHMNYNQDGKKIVDRNGEDMTRIKLKIWDHEGKERFIYTNLWWGENNKMSYRTRSFAESFQVLDMYELGELYDKFGDVIGMTGVCEIYTQKERPKNDGSKEIWPTKNDVRNFIEKEVISSKLINATVKNDDFHDDDVPF